MNVSEEVLRGALENIAKALERCDACHTITPIETEHARDIALAALEHSQRDAAHDEMTLFFVKGSEDIITRGTTRAKMDDDTRYWLGKSPGLYIRDYDELFAVAKKDKIDLMPRLFDFLEEQAESEMRVQEAREKQELLRLKQKYEHQ